MQTEKLQISDIPRAVMDPVCDHIAQYTVGLSRLVRKNNKEDFRLIGSGTLVTVGGLDCVLTAEHVLAEIRNPDSLGLITSFTGELRRHAFPASHLVIHRIAKGTDDSSGPDIGLIVLPQTNIGTLRAEKSFFNIDGRRKLFGSGFLEKDRGLWFTCGILGESEQVLAPTRVFSSVKGYYALCGAGANPREYMEGDSDYLEMRIDYGEPDPELPRSFGGCSGGGIWQAPLRKNNRGEIEVEEYLLSGVIFYQTSIDNGIRQLKGHGRKTVYEQVPEFMEHKRNS